MQEPDPLAPGLCDDWWMDPCKRALGSVIGVQDRAMYTAYAAVRHPFRRTGTA
jgi:hypothetical protein